MVCLLFGFASPPISLGTAPPRVGSCVAGTCCIPADKKLVTEYENVLSERRNHARTVSPNLASIDTPGKHDSHHHGESATLQINFTDLSTCDSPDCEVDAVVIHHSCLWDPRKCCFSSASWRTDTRFPRVKRTPIVSPRRRIDCKIPRSFSGFIPSCFRTMAHRLCARNRSVQSIFQNTGLSGLAVRCGSFCQERSIPSGGYPTARRTRSDVVVPGIWQRMGLSSSYPDQSAFLCKFNRPLISLLQ